MVSTSLQQTAFDAGRNWNLHTGELCRDGDWGVVRMHPMGKNNITDKRIAAKHILEETGVYILVTTVRVQYKNIL